MGQTILYAGALVSLVNVEFRCPDCKHLYHEKDWYPRYSKSKHGLIYMKCKGCEQKLGVTCDMRGDVVVWLKSEEGKRPVTYID